MRPETPKKAATAKGLKGSNAMKAVIQLLRVSTEAQAAEDRASIPAQRAVCAKIAQQYGLTILDTVELVDVSGAAILRAPEMQKLLETIQRGEIHGVVAREFSRLMRPENFADFIILQGFAETKTLLYLPDGPMDFSSKSGRLLGTIRAAIAGLERTEIVERIATAKEELRRAGRWPNSDRALAYGIGYDRQSGTWFYKPESENVRELFRRFLAGERNYERLSELLGVCRGTARNILSNRIYTGVMLYDEKRDPSLKGKRFREGGRQGDRRKIARTPEEIIQVKVIEEGLISEADFQRVQDIIRQKAEHTIRQRVELGQFIYSTFLWCTVCGARLHTWRSTHNYFYYLCSNRRHRKRRDENTRVYCAAPFQRQDRLEPLLDDLFAERLTEHAFLRRLFEYQMAQVERRSDVARVERLRQQVERFENKRQRILDLFVEGEISRDERAFRLAKVDGELRQAKEHLSAETPAPQADPTGLARVFSPFMRWKFLQHADKRQLLAALDPQIKTANYVVDGLSIPCCTAGSHREWDGACQPWPAPGGKAGRHRRARAASGAGRKFDAEVPGTRDLRA
jgi:DNA invertase Pin-like site-specific DNA recombinase